MTRISTSSKEPDEANFAPSLLGTVDGPSTWRAYNCPHILPPRKFSPLELLQVPPQIHASIGQGQGEAVSVFSHLAQIVGQQMPTLHGEKAPILI